MQTMKVYFQVQNQLVCCERSGTLEELDVGWNTRYHRAYRADFTDFQTIGTFRVKVGNTNSATFTIADTSEQLYGPFLGTKYLFI